MNICRVIYIQCMCSNTFNICFIKIISGMIFNLTVITNLDTIYCLLTCCLLFSSESNIKIIEDIDFRITNHGNFSTRCNITIVPNQITISINLTNPETISSRVIRLQTAVTDHVDFIKLINTQTGIKSRI